LLLLTRQNINNRTLLTGCARYFRQNANMSGHPQQGQYDDGYGHPQQGNTDSYYQDDQGQAYYDQHGGYADQGHHQAGGDGYYDESYVFEASTIAESMLTIK